MSTSSSQDPGGIELVIVPAKMVELLIEAVTSVPNCPLPFKVVSAIVTDFGNTQRHASIEELFTAVDSHLHPGASNADMKDGE